MSEEEMEARAERARQYQAEDLRKSEVFYSLSTDDREDVLDMHVDLVIAEDPELLLVILRSKYGGASPEQVNRLRSTRTRLRATAKELLVHYAPQALLQ